MFFMGLFYLEKRKSSLKISLIFGFLAGIFTMFAIAAWGGGAKFLFMIFPVAFFADWIIKKNYSSSKNYFSFYSLWILGILISAKFFGFGIFQIAKNYMLNSFGILTFVVLMYLFFEMLNYRFKIIDDKYSKYHELIIIGAIILAGSVLYQLFIGSIFNLIYDLILKIVSPFGTGRVGLTVAENKQPYLNDLISQVGKVFFYTFLVGCSFVGLKISQGIKNKKLGALFFVSFSFFILGILFSRISPDSLFNGENFISQAFVFISFISFVIVSIYLYKTSSFRVETRWIILAAWMIPMLLGVRSAIRVFFAIVPFISLIVPLIVYELGKLNLKIKEKSIRFIGWVVILFLIFGILISLQGFYNSVSYQAENQQPSYSRDWQNAMSWVRENTAKDALFLHWWDYGYWVQTGGQRASVTDGGHFNGYWDHLIGRYVLTTPRPEIAKSFMKTHQVSYLLIDPTDIGKYSAYSSIGNDLEEDDRESWMSSFVSVPEEIKETKNGKIRIYRGGTALDSDIYYSSNGSEIFLPKYKANIGGMIIESENSEYKQPIGAYIYNNKQHNVPLRYLFVNGELVDFGSGVNATAYLYTRIYDSQGKQLIDSVGAAIYLTEKTKDSLVAQLYLMNDPEDKYSELDLVHEESPFPLPFYYGGFRGPIKIWKVGEMDNILINEEFLATSGEYGSLDYLEFENE
jgi:asparagine N-glycosylation enzyme membrane subunit Stt3